MKRAVTTAAGKALELATSHLVAERLEECERVLMAALRKSPHEVELLFRLAKLLQRQKQWDRGLYFIDQAVAIAPKDAEAQELRGRFLLVLRRFDEAKLAFTAAIENDPKLLTAYDGLSNAWLFKDDIPAAVATLEAGIKAVPSSEEVWGTLASLHLTLGRVDLALETIDRALAVMPDALTRLSHRCIAMNYMPGLDPAQVAAAHRRFGDAVAAVMTPPASFDIDRSPGRRLRIGYLSPDLNSHSVANFIEQPLRHHDRHDFEIVGLFTGRKADDTTTLLRGLCDEWHDVTKVPQQQLHAKIRELTIDVLVELSGHTADHRLYSLARRAAPVQISYLGYPNTTGIHTMDLRLVDALSDPSGVEALATEQLARIPDCAWCYQPLAESPDVQSPPSVRTPGEPFTFGSFNMALKLSTPLIRMWSRVLAAAPGARMLLKCDLRLSGLKRHVLETFESAGIASDRILLAEMTKSVTEHLGAYHRVDVALDTFPYNGTTTTCEAMWMGVPVVTLVGQVHASRVGLSLMSNAGLPELAATTEEEFVAIALGLYHDRERLAMLRTTLRDRMARSPICDGPGFARKLEAIYRSAWAQWCATGSARGSVRT
jgi:protein O-GlcNAc transferase